ncbi:MAG TPA: hypothetical protein V6C76_05645 [Drouetiella sp.]
MMRNRKFLSAFCSVVAACLCSTPAKATLVIIKETAEEVWVAADSRAHINRGTKVSFAEAQKIFELDNSCVFASTGLAGNQTGKIVAPDYARRTDSSTKISPDERAHEYARGFSAPLKATLENMRLKSPNEFSNFFLNKEAVTAMFIDYDKKPRFGVVRFYCREKSNGDLVIDTEYPTPPTNFPAISFFGATEGATKAVMEGGRAFGTADSETQIQTMLDRQAKETPMWVGPPYLMLTIDATGVHWKHKPELHTTEISQ